MARPWLRRSQQSKSSSLHRSSWLQWLRWAGSFPIWSGFVLHCSSFCQVFQAATAAAGSSGAPTVLLPSFAQVQKQALDGQAGPDPVAMRAVAMQAQQLVTSALRCAFGWRSHGICCSKPVSVQERTSRSLTNVRSLIGRRMNQWVFVNCRDTEGGKAGRTARLAGVKAAVTEKLRSIGETLHCTAHLYSGTCSSASQCGALCQLVVSTLATN